LYIEVFELIMAIHTWRRMTKIIIDLNIIENTGFGRVQVRVLGGSGWTGFC